ncbi:pentapeptide repeat-containing protein [Prochlorococcus sp. MIT 1303]|uniref:pentapeptide repeat-containing protein n=1 Tax=Prochlorococcus sp. MIT 1303 TaxID=1723647 RepID=UPI0007B3E9B5|nr:pentapeptide repeat-containing protein [Prochlorococcus sp. MIT 1303]KZR62088.1 Serine/threonine-protein kinase B [Prochlorococcus sp. MIT 1303]
MRRHLIAFMVTLASSAGALVIAQRSEAGSNFEDLVQLQETRACMECRLQDADLMHADLRDVNLKKAQLQRADLGRAQLDGANLSGADLSFATLRHASLRGADLRGATLTGTDLIGADLSGAQLDANGLSSSHWKDAKGVQAVASDYASLHNAGVEEALNGRYPEAEDYFNKALIRRPDAAITWVARGITRAEQAKRELASRDFAFAAELYDQQEQPDIAKQLRDGAEQVKQDPAQRGGNGVGSSILNSATGLFQQLLPIAAKFLSPLAF